ncbi:hypothetical protein GIB67_013819 [Kingdonia uniflora]|uniref:Uncharacterized protein n=1 Tax=Kingdonia uniflora TaxID=39325 RepID=A0A7J7MD86_9MAGN|nr:hypothetical protein GIB67_013819 [Kingdonia uniflora]
MGGPSGSSDRLFDPTELPGEELSDVFRLYFLEYSPHGSTHHPLGWPIAVFTPKSYTLHGV